MDAARNAVVVLLLLPLIGLHDLVDSDFVVVDDVTDKPVTPGAPPALPSAGAHADVLAIPARRRMEG